MLLERDLLERELAKRSGPKLSDGTLLRELINIEERWVALRVFSDPEVYRLELDRVFARVWTLIGHESEVPDVGDFVARKIGEDPVLVVKGSDGDLHVLLNVCAHRGME